MQRELPVGWEYSTLLDAVGGVDSLVVGGPFGSCLKVEHYLDEGVPIIRLQNIGRRKFIRKDIKYVSREKAEELSYHSYQSGDLVLAKLGDPIGKTCIIPDGEENGIVVSDAVRIRNANKNLSSKYLMYILNSDSVSRQLNKQVFGTTRPRVNLQEVRRLVFPLPPLPIQHQIVAVLEKAEAVKRQRQEADVLTEALLQSVFLEMFGDPVRNERGYPKKKLGDTCLKIQDGTHYSPEDQTGEIPYITAKNIRRWGIDLSTATYVTKQIHEKIYSRCDPKKGDVIYIKDGVTAGLAKVNNFDFEFSMLSSIAMIRPDTKILDPFYLEHYLNYPNVYEKIMERKSGSAITRIILREIREIPIVLPTLALQKQFAHIVESVERLRDQQVASGKEIEGLCEGLMKRAFAGDLVG